MGSSRNNRGQNSQRTVPHFLVFIILLLYLLATFNLYYVWDVEISNISITNGKSIWTAYNYQFGTPITLAEGIDAILSTVLADATLIWRCWIVWGRSWQVVLVPIACTTLAIISRGIVTYYTAFRHAENAPSQALYLENAVNWAVLYSSLILTTLLWCTILIIYRILRVGGVTAGMRVYRRVIEILVESASLYSALIAVLLMFQVRNKAAGIYVEVLAVAMRGIAPTVLVGRVAAGHARPDDSWSGSTTGSSLRWSLLRFRSHSNSQTDSQMSAGSGWDTSSHVRPDLEEGLEGSTRG
ncbi:uncharacterized protein EV420DRAFT_883522 [Desarmillaria tabescens]|uniref:Uncharacterized protein n=1 Tax=Armillaria tabescens TaxID=1929756 RepID=A0AA39JR35_ARMTA|nr:uncharacterized protein EV420DRAFT_883522 [Desarmillaria tabescens]KAK0446967.1 hypothetical protein EV420DRAFT_883522 [Desarmillaria tabescens]